MSIQSVTLLESYIPELLNLTIITPRCSEKNTWIGKKNTWMVKFRFQEDYFKMCHHQINNREFNDSA